jgi:DNA-binding transcriptional regulator LsrR (DeoR family)
VLRPATHVDVAAVNKISTKGISTVLAKGRESKIVPIAIMKAKERIITCPGENLF